MNQVEQMLREIELNAQRRIAVVNNKVILVEDKPKYDALLNLKDFITRNQAIFSELHSKASAAGVDVNSLVSSYAPVMEPSLNEEQREKEPVAPVQTADLDHRDFFEPPVINGNNQHDSNIPEVPVTAPEAEVGLNEQEGRNIPVEDSDDFSISQFVKTDHVELTLKFPENEVDVLHALNTWVAQNIIVPNGYICYAKINEAGDAEIYMGHFDKLTWEDEKDRKLYGEARKDLILYYDPALINDFSVFEQKHSITRINQISLPVKLFKKRLYDTVPYIPETSNEEKIENKVNIDALADEEPQTLAVPAQMPASSAVTNDNANDSEITLNALIPSDTLTINANIPQNKYSVHDALRKWVVDNVAVPKGYVVYVTVPEIDSAVIYLGKKNSDSSDELHTLKTLNVDVWEHIINVTRLDSKVCSLIVNKADLTNDPSNAQLNVQSGVSSINPAGDLTQETEDQASLANDDLNNIQEQVASAQKVTGRRLTNWATTNSKPSIIRKGLSLLSKISGRSDKYIAYMEDLSMIDLKDSDALIMLADVENRLERDLEIDSVETEKIQKKLNKLVDLAQKNNKGRA